MNGRKGKCESEGKGVSDKSPRHHYFIEGMETARGAERPWRFELVGRHVQWMTKERRGNRGVEWKKEREWEEKYGVEERKGN